MPLRLGGNIWNWHVGGPAEMEDALGDSRYPDGAKPENVNTTRAMYLATVPGPPNTTQVIIHADRGTAFADYYGTNNVVASRARRVILDLTTGRWLRTPAAVTSLGTPVLPESECRSHSAHPRDCLPSTAIPHRC